MSNIDQIEKIMMFQGILDQGRTKLKQMKKDLLAACDKKCGYYKISEEYTPGSYLDTSYTTTYGTCEVCGRSDEINVVSHGSYN